jgi:Zn-dependent protease with chaperone function
LDPQVPEKEIDSFFQNQQMEYDQHKYDMDFEYSGEKLNLVIAIMIAIAITALFSVITIMLFIPILLILLLSFRLQQIKYRDTLLAISKNNLPEIYNLLRVACFRLKMNLLPAYIQQNPTPNAFTMGLFQDNWMVIYSSLLDLLNKDEILFVIGHEIAHAKKRHTTWLIFSGPAHQQRIPFLSALMSPLFNSWSVKAEYTADNGGLIACRNLYAAILTQLKLAGGKDVVKDIDVNAFLEKLPQKGNDSDVILEPLLGTHPFYKNRIRQLRNFHNSADYRRLTN